MFRTVNRTLLAGLMGLAFGCSESGQIQGEVLATTAMDEEYLYWTTRTSINRKRKF